MNPFFWTLLHRIARLIVSLTGTVAGALFAFIRSPLFFSPEGWRAFEDWLEVPGNYWVWSAAGFFGTALLFYLMQLPRSSN